MFDSQWRAQGNNRETDLLISIRLLKWSNTSNEITQLIKNIVAACAAWVVGNTSNIYSHGQEHKIFARKVVWFCCSRYRTKPCYFMGLNKKTALIRATKSCNLSSNIALRCKLQSECCSYYHPKFCCATLHSFSTPCNKENYPQEVVIQATFALQLATQKYCTTSCTIL